MKKNTFVSSIKTLLLALILAAGVGYISAWTGPTAVAPQGNADAPLNVGAISQYKNGPLVVNYLGSATPGLEVMGPIQIVDLTQGAGKVLMSDAAGVSHWAATSTLGFGAAATTTGTSITCNWTGTKHTSGNQSGIADDLYTTCTKGIVTHMSYN